MRAAILLLALAFTGGLAAATLTGTLKPKTVNLGNSTTLTLRCEGGAPPTVQPVNIPRNLALIFESSGKEPAAGQNTVTIFKYRVTPKIAGRFAVPAFKAIVNGQIIQSEALVLTVLNRNGGTAPGASGKNPAAMLKATTPARDLYVGQAFELDMELMAQGLRQSHLPVPQTLTEGIRFTRIRPQFQQTRTRPFGGKLFHVFRFQTGAVFMKPGRANLLFEVEVNVMDYSRDVFGREVQQHLTSDPIVINIRSLPQADRPKQFTGAVGQFQLVTTAKPTTLKTGEPIELSIRLFGTGALEDTPVPAPANWKGFKLLPASADIDYRDTRHLSASKSFKQMIIPLRPDITQVPPISFSFFNPDKKEYVTLNSPAIPLDVSGSPIHSIPSGDPEIVQPAAEPENELHKLHTIREHPGNLAPPRAPLLGQAWFLAIPGLSLLAFLTAFVIRQRAEYLDAHEQTARRLEVNRLTKKLMATLRQPATQADPAKFFAGIQAVLRANLGLALRQPADGITAQTLEDSSLDLPEHTREALDRLMAQDNLTRFANDDGPINAGNALGDLQLVLRHLR